MSFRNRVLQLMNKQKSVEKRELKKASSLNHDVTEIRFEFDGAGQSEHCNNNRDPHMSKLSNQILQILQDNILFGYPTLYQSEDYWMLLEKIYELVSEKRIIKLFLPAFPAKSSNKYQKVLGVDVDFAECIGIDNLLTVARKIEAIYDAGVLIIIMSDYHTFDQYIQVVEEDYNHYHQGLKEMIKEKGGDDVIQLINLSYFQQFGNVPERKISATLAANFGGNAFRESFSEEVKTSPVLLKRYTQQKKFFKFDLSHILMRAPNSRRKKILKEVATGMISQGVALDAFLRQQNCIKNYIRLSIHQHHPETGKFAIDLFKNKCFVYGDAQLRTPWHNTVIFDTTKGIFYVNFKENVHRLIKAKDHFLTVLVHLREKPYFYLKLLLAKHVPKESVQLNANMIKHSCGIILEVPKSSQLKVNIFKSHSIIAMVKEFGVVVLRGFKDFEDENDFVSYYKNHMDQKILNWSFGSIHKVMPSKEMPGYVNSFDGIPVHWDMAAPPKYMGVDQNIHQYQDFTCPVFALYCRNIDRSDGDDEDKENKNNIGQQKSQEGATTFVDAVGAVKSLHGRTIQEWKDIKLRYETQLMKKDEGGKEVYFGGEANSYTYPLIHECPNQPGKETIRWWQNWPKEEFPNAKQHNNHTIESAPESLQDMTAEELEANIRNVAFDHRFFFSHRYEKGDLVFVNNYTTLHGRCAFTHTQRELWRIQTLPETKNLPPYFK